MKHEIVSEQQHGADERVSSSNNAENIMLKHGCINQSETEVSSTTAAGTTKWGPDSLSDTHAVKRTSTRRRDSAPPLATAAPPDRRGVHSGVSESLRWPTKLSSSSSRKEVSNSGGRRISLQQWLSVAVKARKEEWGILVPVDAALSPIADQRQNSRRSKSSSNNDSEKSNIRVNSDEHADDFKKRGTSSFFPEETLPVNMMGKDEDLARKDGGPGRNREEELFVGEHTYAESEEGAPALAAARVHRDYEADEEKSGIRSTTGERYPVQPPQHPTATEVDRGPSLLISSSSSSSSLSSITSSSSARKNLKPPPPPLQQYRQAETVTSAEENKHVETNSSAVSKSQGDHHVKFLSAAEELTVAIGEDNQQGLTPNEDAETMYSHLPASPCSGAILPFSPRYATLQKFRKYMALRGIDAKVKVPMQ